MALEYLFDKSGYSDDVFFPGDLLPGLGVLIALIFGGLIFSLPTFAVVYILLSPLTRITKSYIIKRSICCVVANIGVLITWWLIEGSIVTKMMLSYVVGTTLSFVLVRTNRVG